jgi:hypothetical protein
VRVMHLSSQAYTVSSASILRSTPSVFSFAECTLVSLMPPVGGAQGP